MEKSRCEYCGSSEGKKCTDHPFLGDLVYMCDNCLITSEKVAEERQGKLVHLLNVMEIEFKKRIQPRMVLCPTCKGEGWATPGEAEHASTHQEGTSEERNQTGSERKDQKDVPSPETLVDTAEPPSDDRIDINTLESMNANNRE